MSLSAPSQIKGEVPAYWPKGYLVADDNGGDKVVFTVKELLVEMNFKIDAILKEMQKLQDEKADKTALNEAFLQLKAQQTELVAMRVLSDAQKVHINESDMKRRFWLSILLPSVLTIALALLALFTGHSIHI